MTAFSNLSFIILHSQTIEQSVTISLSPDPHNHNHLLTEEIGGCIPGFFFAHYLLCFFSTALAWSIFGFVPPQLNFMLSTSAYNLTLFNCFCSYLKSRISIHTRFKLSTQLKLISDMDNLLYTNMCIICVKPSNVQTCVTKGKALWVAVFTYTHIHTHHMII